MTKHETHLKYLLIFSGLFNIIFATPLLIPKISDYYLTFLGNVNNFLKLGGVAYASPSNPVHSLLINTAGIDLVLIGIIVLYASFDPIQRKGIILFNAIGRTVFFLIICYYIIFENILRIVFTFGLIDLIISLMFVLFLLKTKKILENL